MCDIAGISTHVSSHHSNIGFCLSHFPASSFLHNIAYCPPLITWTYSSTIHLIVTLLITWIATSTKHLIVLISLLGQIPPQYTLLSSSHYLDIFLHNTPYCPHYLNIFLHNTPYCPPPHYLGSYLHNIPYCPHLITLDLFLHTTSYCPPLITWIYFSTIHLIVLVSLLG